MQTISSTLFLAASFVLAGTADPPAAQKPPSTPEKQTAASLEGGYVIVSGEKDGKPIPEAEIAGSIVKFTGDSILGTDKDKKEFFSATYSLDTSKTPWVITMKGKEPKEMTATGLIKKEGDTVTLIYALPGGEAPKEFMTREKQHLFVLKSNSKGVKDPNKFTKEP